MNTSYQPALEIGWATADITPDRPVNLQGQFYARVSQGVRDPLTVTALAIANPGAAGDAVVLLSVDNCFLSRDVVAKIRALAAGLAPGLDPSKIILNTTHTHTAPVLKDGFYPPVPPGAMTGAEYTDLLASRAADAVAEAWRRRAPGSVGWGLGHAVVGRNRRAVYFDDLTRRPAFRFQPGTSTVRNAAMYGNTADPMFSHIEGYEDHGVDLLYTWDAHDNLTGVLVNLACPSQVTSWLREISADFWHETRLALRQALGENVFILPQCAAAGDQAPTTMWYQKAEQRMQELRGLDQRAEIARRIAGTVVEVLPFARKDRCAQAPVRHVVEDVTLPRRPITDEEVAMLRAGVAELEAAPPSDDPDPAKRAYHDSWRGSALHRCQRALARHARRAADPVLRVELHAVWLGDIAFVSVPFELFLDYGIRIKARSSAVQTFMIQLAGAALGWEGGYLPTARAEQGGSYSANCYCNSVGSEGGATLVEAALRMLDACHDPLSSVALAKAGG